MKGVLNIFVNDETANEYDEKLEISESFEDENTYLIGCNVSDDESFLDIIKDNKNICALLKYAKYNTFFQSNSSINYYELVKNKLPKLRLFLECEIANFHGNPESIKAFLDRNPLFRSKKIVISDIDSLDYNLYNRLKKIFNKYPNVYFQVMGNTEGITLQEYEKTIIAINEIVNHIKKYNYSPFEAMIHAYDLVRDRFYVKEGQNEKSNVSRDLSSVLLGDKIVCLGFARIYKTVLDCLNIPSMIFILDDNEHNERHARILAPIKDEKYDLDGLYFFDPTFDCKKDHQNTFLRSYRFFAKSKRQIDNLTHYNFDYGDYSFLDEDKVIELDENCPERNLSSYDLLKYFPFSRINRLLILLGKPEVNITLETNTKEKIIDTLYDLLEYSSRSIPSQTFIKALYKVRKNEYYENPQKYLFDIRILTEIMYKSKFDVLDTEEERVIHAIIGDNSNISIQVAHRKVVSYLSQNALDVDMERTILTKTLSNILKKRQQLENK